MSHTNTTCSAKPYAGTSAPGFNPCAPNTSRNCTHTSVPAESKKQCAVRVAKQVFAMALRRLKCTSESTGQSVRSLQMASTCEQPTRMRNVELQSCELVCATENDSYK